MINIDNLYFGLGYENHAKGQLMRLGYEAFKMEADFGFDLLVSNQAKKTYKNVLHNDSCVFQIKAGRVHDWEESEAEAGNRKKGTAIFYLSKEHLDNLKNEKKSYLLCYIVDGKDHDTVKGYFWLNNYHIKYLTEGKNPSYNSTWTWFHEKKDYLYLKVEIVLEAKLEQQYENFITEFENVVESQIKDLGQKNEFTMLKNKLKKLVSKSDITNNNSNSRISLFGINSAGESRRRLETDLRNLSKFSEINNKAPVY